MSPGPYSLMVLALVAAAASVPHAQLWRAAALGAAALALTLPLSRPSRSWLARLLAASFFIALLALGVLLRRPSSPGDALAISIGPLHATLSRAALLIAAGVTLKAAVAVVALTAAASALGETGWLSALSSLRIPGPLLAVLFLMARYLHVSSAMASRAMRAASARGQPQSIAARARLAGSIAGALLVRGFERAERIGWAMASRGFTGRWPFRPPAAPLAQWLLACALSAAAWAAALLPS